MNKQKGAINIILIVIIVILLVFVGYLTFNKKSATPITSEWKKYSDSSIEFEYPSILTEEKVGAEIVLRHSIAYEHPNPCDFKGESAPLSKLFDFEIYMKVVNKSPKDYVDGGTSPTWDYVSKNPFVSGSWKGYKIQEGIEGCGRDIYYLTISPTKTLVIERPFVTEFNPIIGDYQKYLALPGIITPNQAEDYFNKILNSLKVK